MAIEWHDLHAPDPTASLYLRALRTRTIRGKTLPAHGLRCTLRVDRDHLAAYRGLCRFPDDSHLPATYPHVLAFGLHLQLMTAPDFPFPLLGMVHLGNRLEVLRPLGALDSLQFAVHAENLRPHAKGGTFDLVTEAEDGLGVIWRETSRMLVRGLRLDVPADADATAHDAPSTQAPLTRWYADSDIGRRYAKVSGDYNPIHLSAVSARLFGFPTAIAHGMYSLARTLAALQDHLPSSGHGVEVAFHKPIRLPSEVILSTSDLQGTTGQMRLEGHSGPLHLEGRWYGLT
ncbi:acyl dehydratase [Pseudomonas entomophila]|uniref:MaoC family dehydratase n=1 Tax=Pseudomonas entomophila TaxID=312306 RepID=UPI0015E4434E|nr:MaoC/PaaZ C-terminal domain-containing protein [Pseudomonas entomophila]MBA1190494.1 acyl dehydratase [Pseudomonas entomophila]